MFKKILVPLDGSKLAAKVLPKVTELAKACKSQVTLVHVCHTEQMGEAPGSVLAAEVEQEKKVCQTFLSKAAKDLEDAGLKVDFVCIEGVPAREIGRASCRERV